MNNAQGSSNRIEHAKRQFKSRSTDDIKIDIKKRFIARMRLSRSVSIDRFREILQDECTNFQSIEEMKRALVDLSEAKYLMNDSDVQRIIEEIESELKQVQLEKEANHFTKISDMETIDILERHLCHICNNDYTEDDVLCSSCKKNVIFHLKE